MLQRSSLMWVAILGILLLPQSALAQRGTVRVTNKSGHCARMAGYYVTAHAKRLETQGNVGGNGGIFDVKYGNMVAALRIEAKVFLNSNCSGGPTVDVSPYVTRDYNSRLELISTGNNTFRIIR